MNTLRKIFLFLIVLGFGGLILLNAGIWTARMTVLDREVTKSWLQKSSVYNNFVGELSDLVKQDQAKMGSENPDGGFDTEAITRAAKEAFPPATLQENVEAVLDGTYDWLEQKTSTLVINLDFSQEKQIFIDAMGNEGLSRIASLPACQSSETTEDFDPFSATCLPSGANASALMDSFKSEIASSDSVLPDTTLNSADITIDYKGEKKPIDVAFSEAPSWYGLLTSSPIILAVLVIFDSALIVLLSKPKRSGYKILSWFFGIAGGSLMLFGGASVLLATTITKSVIHESGDGGLAESILLPLIREVSASIGKWNMITGGIYIAIAVGLAILYITLKKKNPEAGDTEKKEPEHPAPVEEKPQQPASTTKVQ